MGVTNGFSDLSTTVRSLQGKDFANVHVGVEPTLLQALIEGFGVFAQLQEAFVLQGSSGNRQHPEQDCEGVYVSILPQDKPFQAANHTKSKKVCIVAASLC